jgi:hypothetical protein
MDIFKQLFEFSEENRIFNIFRFMEISLFQARGLWLRGT